MFNTNWQERARGISFDVRDFIEGRPTVNVSATRLEKYGPRDGRLLYTIPSSGPAGVDQAVMSARRAFEDGRWSQRSIQQRKDVLLRLADLVDSKREELALLECLDVGKPISDALLIDIPMTCAGLRYCAEASDKVHSRVYGSDPFSLSYELCRPIGVVGGIVGWNFPLSLAMQKLAPALATGNTLVLKPSEWTSLSASRMAELALEAGVPPGVFNVVHGNREVGSRLAHHPDVDLLSFTGSSATGRALMVAAGSSNMKRLILECGGKAPNIVFDDCPDLGAVADHVIRSAFWNQGEVCAASSRLLIQASIKSDLLSRLIERLTELRPSDPLDGNTRFGALVSQAHLDKVSGYLALAQREGGHLAYRGEFKTPVEGGFYFAPCVIDGVTSRQRIAQEEVFGPLLAVLSFNDEAEAVRMANDTVYGLTATVWTENLGRAHRASQAIRAGSITVNATARPQGGVGDSVLTIGGHRQSGLGVEGGLAGLKAYMSSTAVQYFV